MKCRTSVAGLSAADKAAYIQAVLDLKDPVKSPSRIALAAAAVAAGGGTPNRYDDFVYIHNVVGMGAHRGSAFGPWHREFLRQFENDLQRVSGNREMTIPYWDWISDRTPQAPGWPFTPDFMGGFGNAVTGVVTSGPFAGAANWRVNIRRSSDSVVELKRSRGVPAAADLPTADDVRRAVGQGVAAGQRWPRLYDSAPFNGNPPTTNPAFANQVLAAFRKYLEFLLHDGVHVWVGDMWSNNTDGGQMSFPAVSVNDPVFFLHHANVDRLWATWQRRSPTPGFLPASGAAAGHNAGDVMSQFADQSAFGLPLLARPNKLEDHQAVGPWYDTDPPVVSQTSSSVAFGEVPDGITIAAPIEFTVQTCQPVLLTVTGVTGANFGTPVGQNSVMVGRVPGSDSQIATLQVTFHAQGPADVEQVGSVTVEATYVDRDGYDTPAAGSSVLLGSFTIAGTATPTTPIQEIAMTDGGKAMDHHAGHQGDHENMHFEMLRLDDSDNLVHVDIARDLSDYDEDGNDPGPKRSGAPDSAEEPE